MTDVFKTHPSFTHNQEIIGLCNPLAIFNITTFANARITEKQEFSTICTNPNFMSNYIENGYHNADVHVRKNHATMDNCFMWDAMECFGKTEQMILDAAAFNNRHIFTIVEPSATHTDFYHFGTHLNMPSINQWYINHLDLLHLFIEYYSEKIVQSPLLATGHDIKIPIQSKSESFQIKYIIDPLEQDEKTHQFLNSIQYKHRMLSPREEECITLLAQGMSAKEIARKLNLSYRTIEDYTAILKKKFQAKNKAALIAAILQYLA